MGKPTDLLQGTLDLLILKTLALAPMHGWGITLRIQQISGDVLQVTSRRSLSGAASTRTSRLDSCEVGRDGRWPSRKILLAYACGPSAARTRSGPVASPVVGGDSTP